MTNRSQLKRKSPQDNEAPTNIMDFYFNGFLKDVEMTPMQIENIALILRHSPIESLNKETLLLILQRLCSNVKELLNSAQRLQIFNVFLSRVEFGLPLPVEFAIGTLLQSTAAVNGKLSEDVACELDVCRMLCGNLLECRMQLILGSNRKEEKVDQASAEKPSEILEDKKCNVERSPTPPIIITLDESQDVIEVSDDDDEKVTTIDKKQSNVDEDLVDLF